VVLVNCDACRQAVIRDERASPRQVRVLKNGVDLQRFRNRGQLESSAKPARGMAQCRIGIVANLRRVKNLDLFLRAAADVADDFPEATFHIAGDGELQRDLEHLAKDLGIAGRLVFHGSVADIPAFVAQQNVAVLCSSSEGMSNALLEYMAAGKAIVATAVGGIIELMENNVHGLLVPVGDQARLAGAIRRLLRDPGLGRRLGAAARKRVENSYGREAMVRRFEMFYQELMGFGKR
jgi:glycosyltransferase involved in cell wall biosynthesis